MVMRWFPSPFSGLRSESARFDEARPLTWFAYKVARDFFKPSNFVKFRKVDRQAQDAPTLGTGGRESVGEGFGLADRHRTDMDDWMGDRASNRALCQCGVGAISEGSSDPFDAFEGSLTIE